MQAQDVRAAGLGIRVRANGLTAADVRRALEEDWSVVHGWFLRGTLHMVPSADASCYKALYRLQTAYRDGPQGQEAALARLVAMDPGRLRIPDTADGHRLRAARRSARDQHAQP